MRHQRLTKVMVILPLCLFTFSSLQAQNTQKFLDTLKQKQQGQGSVTVTQSKEIDELVNGKPAEPAAPAATSTTPTASSTVVATPSVAATQPATTAAPTTPSTPPAAVSPTTSSETAATEAATVDTRKKVMRNSYKVTGYRVQVFAGGNSRADRVKAEETRDKVKAKFPTQPIYVHFYSPRWICRMGNFRSYDEANRVCKQVKAMGYPQACVIKGKISVQY